MPATSPPADLAGFPATTLDAGATAFRIFQARELRTGARRTPWFFSNLASPRPGRFDVTAPNGSCYLSDRRHGAWLEVFRGCGLVDRADVERRRLFTAVRTGPPVRLADLRSAGARRFGVTADLAAGDGYALPQTWAAAVLRAKFQGLAGTVRHDPTHVARNLVLFGTAGPRSRVSGWRGTVTTLVSDTLLLGELAPFGTGVASRPFDVPITPAS